MNRSSVARVLRAGGAFNFLASLVLLLFYRPVITLIGWPHTDTPIYANVLGAALIGLSLTVWFAANHLEQSRETILASLIAKGLAAIIILYWVFIARIELPSAWLLHPAVSVQVLFALGEAAYLYSHLRYARST